MSDKLFEKQFKERAEFLVSQMTLDEKVAQLMHLAPSIERLGLKSYSWWNEALHGVARAGIATVFPQAIAMAATFDENLIFEIADTISTEGRAKFHEMQRQGDHGTYKGLTFWSPNINIFRDPRWGRGHETYGEDPYLTSKLGVSYIKGIQGSHPKYLKAAACIKHFVAHSGPESCRHNFNSEVSNKDLYETYLPAFESCIKEANVEAVMGAYNMINGEPCCGSKSLIKGILRDKLSFKGHFVSDCGAVHNFHTNQGLTNDLSESAALAVNAGCDLNCGNSYIGLFKAVEDGLITEETINESVKRLMMTRLKLGMLDNEEDNPYSKISFEENDSLRNNQLSQKASEKSLVLLKNENLLPLDKKKYKRIAVIGPNADSRAVLSGNYCGTASRYYTVLDGIRDYMGDDGEVLYSQGCHLYEDRVEACAEEDDRTSEALAIADRSDVVIMCLGLDPNIEGEEGDAFNEYGSGDKPNLNLPGLQNHLLEQIYKTGKPVILVLLTGSAVSIQWAKDNIPAIICAFYTGSNGGKAIARLIFGDFSPAGRLPVTFYKTTEELPPFTDYLMENRTYRYMKNEALYPFGYGLSFTQFEFSDLRLDKDVIKSGEDINLRVKVKNIGEYDSDEVIQLYLKDNDSSLVALPKYQLKGFKRVFIRKGEIKDITFTVHSSDMMLVDNDGRRLIERGDFTIYIGGSQPDRESTFLTGKNCLQAGFTVE